MSDLLDHCWIHNEAPCDCPADLVTMGCMDLQIERLLETNPRFSAELLARLRGNREHSPS